MDNKTMPVFSRLVLTFVLTTAALASSYEEYTFEGYGFYYYSDSYKDSTNCHDRDGIWRVDLKTGEEKKIFGDNSGRFLIERCDLSYHGKQLVFHGTSIGNGIINNDGTGYKKLPSDLPLTTVNVPLTWTRLGIFRTKGGTLRRYDVLSGEYEEVAFPTVPGWDDNSFKGGWDTPVCLASGDGTRLWNRTYYKTISFGPKQYGYPKVGGNTISYTFFILNEDGSPARMFGRNFWGHGDVITLDGETMYWQDFGHEGWWIGRHSDGQKIADLQRKRLPVPAPDFHTACGERDVVQDARHPIQHCTNDNDWFYLFTAARFLGLPDEGINEACFFNTVWNRKTNKYIRVHGPMDGAWLPRCRSTSAIQCAGIWKGSDLPSPEENSAYLVAYENNVTFHCAQQTTPLEQTVRIGNIDDTVLDNVTFSVEPPSAESWLTPSFEHSDVTITMKLRVDASALPEGNNHDATVTVRATSARNSASVAIHADKTMLPRPADFVVFHANKSDSFAYPKLTWEDRADGEEGYIVEFHTNHDFNTTWKALDTVGADAVHYISRLHTYTDETKSGKYRIRAYSTDGTFSPYSDEGYFCVPPDSMVPPDPDWIHEGWSVDSSSSSRFDIPHRVSRNSGMSPMVTLSGGVIVLHVPSVSFQGIVRVVHPDGRMVMDRSIHIKEAETMTIPFSSRSAGVYLLQIIDTTTDRHSVVKYLALSK